MRTLAVDLGTRRVGLALSDEGGKFATPYDVLDVGSTGEAIEPVRELIRKEGVRRVVVGLPLNMDDTAGRPATEAAAWGRRLGELCNIPVIFVDERLSTFQAEQSLKDRKGGGERMTRADKKARLDAIAAASFLQEFLDGKLVPMQIDKA